MSFPDPSTMSSDELRHLHQRIVKLLTKRLMAQHQRLQAQQRQLNALLAVLEDHSTADDRKTPTSRKRQRKK